MKVSIYGPNLRTQAEAMHVHAPDCADTRKPLYRGHEPWIIDVETTDEITFSVYPPGDFDYDGTDPEENKLYASDIRIFPCVKGLK